MNEEYSSAINAVVLGGNGAVGSLLCASLADTGIRTVAIDIAPAPAQLQRDIGFISADVHRLPPAAYSILADADWVIAALPESVTLATWEAIIGNQKSGSLFVDTLSVKLPLISAMANRSPTLVEVLSINPMFAPSLGFRNQNVAVIKIQCGPHADRFLHLLRGLGSNLQFLDAEQHDRFAALIQSATHVTILAFGLALYRQRYDLPMARPVMTPPHRALLSLLARILNASPEVYWDIQAGNAFAAEARRALADGLRELTQIIDSGDQFRFSQLFADLREIFGSDALAEFENNCARMLKGDDA
jgi:prephenate dehydrogenase